MKRIKSWLVGASVASVNLVTVVNQVFHPARCSGSCGSCTFSCVPTVLGVAGLGILVIVYRKMKYKFLSIKNRLQQFVHKCRFETRKPVVQSQTGPNPYLFSVPREKTNGKHAGGDM